MKPSDFFPVDNLWWFPLGPAAFALVALLIAPIDLPGVLIEHTVPSLVLYLVGGGHIAFAKDLFHRRHLANKLVEHGLAEGDIRGIPPNERNLELPTMLIFLGAQLLWLIALLAYNLYFMWLFTILCG